jgi:hypothetical protein
MEIKKEDKKGLLQNELVIFFIGPLLFLILVRFTGYQIFYNQDRRDNSRKKFVMLLSAGSGFYLVLIILLVALNT